MPLLTLDRVSLHYGTQVLLDHVDRARYCILPNTAGCFDAATAVRTAELSRELDAVHRMDELK